jgi:hypothetical protein
MRITNAMKMKNAQKCYVITVGSFHYDECGAAFQSNYFVVAADNLGDACFSWLRKLKCNEGIQSIEEIYFLGNESLEKAFVRLQEHTGWDEILRLAYSRGISGGGCWKITTTTGFLEKDRNLRLVIKQCWRQARKIFLMQCHHRAVTEERVGRVKRRAFLRGFLNEENMNDYGDYIERSEE